MNKFINYLYSIIIVLQLYFLVFEIIPHDIQKECELFQNYFDNPILIFLKYFIYYFLLLTPVNIICIFLINRINKILSLKIILIMTCFNVIFISGILFINHLNANKTSPGPRLQNSYLCIKVM